jgi:hypothetical protein
MKQIKTLIVAILLFSVSFAGKGIQKVIFEEKQIEGKIRRPQLVLIRADQRPDFKSMVMQSLDTVLNVDELGRGSVLEKYPNSEAFLFNNNGTISNFVP